MVFAMTSVFSWKTNNNNNNNNNKNSVSICPASFCTPRPNLSVTLSISWLPTFAFQSPMMKSTSFSCLFKEILKFFMEFAYCTLFGISGLGMDLDCCDSEWLALQTNWYYSVILEITLNYCILKSFVDYEGYFISSKGFLLTVVVIMVIELNSPIAQLLKNPPAMQETWVQSLGWEDPLEKGKATHSSILAWRIPWTV